MPTYPPTTEPTSSVSSPITASSVSPVPVPTHGAGGTFSVLAKTRIAAPPLEVLNLIRNTTTWPQWNSFCPKGVVTKSPPSNPKPTTEDEEEETAHEDLELGKENWLEVGTEVLIDVHMSGDGLVPGKKRSRTQTITITVLEAITSSLLPAAHQSSPLEEVKGYRIAWKSQGWAHWQLHSERVMEFLEIGGEGGVSTEYVCWETFGGVLGGPVRAAVGGTLVDRFGDYARDVKRFLEGGNGAGGVS